MQPQQFKRFLSVIIYSIITCALPYCAGAQTASPTITATPLTGNIYACFGTKSQDPNIGQFRVSGKNLTSDITVAAPAGFAVSLTGQDYANSVTLNETAGTLSDAVVYVSLTGQAKVGVNTGNVALTSGSA